MSHATPTRPAIAGCRTCVLLSQHATVPALIPHPPSNRAARIAENGTLVPHSVPRGVPPQIRHVEHLVFHFPAKCSIAQIRMEHNGTGFGTVHTARGPCRGRSTHHPPPSSGLERAGAPAAPTRSAPTSRRPATTCTVGNVSQTPEELPPCTSTHVRSRIGVFDVLAQSRALHQEPRHHQAPNRPAPPRLQRHRRPLVARKPGHDAARQRRRRRHLVQAP